MRVLAFCDYYQPDSCGGSERVAREVYQRLAANHDVDITVIGAVPSMQGTQRAVVRGGDHGVASVLVPAHDLSDRLGVQLLLSGRLPRLAADLVRTFKPTVLHANSLHFQSTLIAAGLARRYRIPLVTTAHLAGAESLDRGLRIAATGWDQTMGRAIIAASTGVVAVSEAVAAHVRTLGLGQRKLTVALNGVDHDVFHARGRTDDDTRPLRVGFVGRLITNKGPDVFLRGVARALELGADLQISVIGDGPMRAQLQEMAQLPPLAGRVEFTGQVDDVARRMRELDVVVRSSFTEGLPLAVVEAMASGVVVVASDVPGNVELVSHEVSGYIFPVGDIDTLASRLGSLDRDRARLRVLQQRAVENAASFSWDSSSERHMHALMEAIAMVPELARSA
jgi:glycosyltransferase involved in cell wall biosynthesis